MREERNRRKRPPKLLRRLSLIVTLALVLILAQVLSPFVKSWVFKILPGIDYDTASMVLTHQMEKAGELIAVRHTETAVMTGTRDALWFGTVSKVTAPYLYEIGLGIRLEDVKLEIGDSELIVTVPDAQMLYDHFQVTGDIQKDDFWGLLNEQTFQQMQDEEHAACRQRYLDDSQCMKEAWDAACEQLETLFIQWTGEELRLQFRPESGKN